jgi:response regulator NasT
VIAGQRQLFRIGENVPMSPKGKILVVDDDRLVLATITHGLANAGYEVIDADNGDDAILLARQHRPDLALLDIRMEGMSGFDVAAYLRESLGTPFMFLSAFSDDATVAQVKALGAIAYLIKPLDITQIVPTVDAALHAVRTRRRRQAGEAPPPPPVPRPDPFAAGGPSTGFGGLVEPAFVPNPADEEIVIPDPLADTVPIAVGVLMHRFSLSRNEALERLRRMAYRDGVALQAEADRMLAALELLARPASA